MGMWKCSAETAITVEGGAPYRCLGPLHSLFLSAVLAAYSLWPPLCAVQDAGNFYNVLANAINGEKG